MDNKTKDAVHVLWDEILNLGADRSEDAMKKVMTDLCGLINAQNSSWVGALRVSTAKKDPLKGWRTPVAKKLYPPLPTSPDLQKQLQENFNTRKMDPSFLLCVRNPGRFRHWSMRGSMPTKWYRTSFYKDYFFSRGIYDFLHVSFPVNRDAESVFGFDRVGSRKPFGAGDIETLYYALRGLGWFHKQILLCHGLLASRSPVLPSERKVLDLLLTEASEKEIARKVGLTPATTHQYIKSIYRKFGVQGRSGLMSLWIGRAR